MIVPHGEAQYYRERPRIAIPKSSVVDLDGHFGLHPQLAPLKPFWDGGSLAAIHAVGSPDGTRSHFDAQDYMESGTPGVKSTADGWANRYCQNAAEHTDTPFRAVAFGPQLPRIMAGTAPALAIDDLRSFGMGSRAGAGGDKLSRAFEALYQGAATGLLATSAEESFEAIRMLKTANPAGRPAEHGAEYPRGRLGQSLQQIAQLIKAGLGLEIAFADMSGWDTHVNQGSEQGQLSLRLAELGQALAAFATDLGERMSDVCVLTMSEFGRTIKENGTGGTDSRARYRDARAGWNGPGKTSGGALARARSGRALRGPGRGGHHGFPRSVRRDPHAPPRRARPRLGLSRVFRRRRTVSRGHPDLM
jgi:uncharacterized protein (DUF1501 family)